MGYNTDFTGTLSFNHEVTLQEVGYLSMFLGKDVRDLNQKLFTPEEVKAFYHINIEFVHPYDDKTQLPCGLTWDGCEKTYGMEQIIPFLIARGKEINPKFSLSGVFECNGEETGDHWFLTVENNVITVENIEEKIKRECKPDTGVLMEAIYKNIEKYLSDEYLDDCNYSTSHVLKSIKEAIEFVEKEKQK